MLRMSCLRPLSTPHKKRQKSVVRREAVSAEPILPDEAEIFEPTRVPKDASTVAMLCQVTRRNPLFGSLDDDELTTVVDAMVSESFSKGSEVLRQGEVSTNRFYFITKGTVEIVKSGIGTVCSFCEGQTFGELELMYLSPCAATVKCSTDVETYSIDRDTYRHIVMMVSVRKRRLYKELLGNVRFLSRMTSYEAMTLADALEPVSFATGDYIVRFGDDSQYMHIIVEGAVKVVGRDENDQKKLVEVCTFGRGDAVGELEFLNKHAAVADVIATTKVKTCRLHREHFEMCMGPLVDYLKDNAQTDKYAYYRRVVQDDGSGKVLTRFRFGDAPQEEDETKEEKFCEGEGDESPAAAGNDAAQRSSLPNARRVAVSDEPTDDTDQSWVPPKIPKEDEVKKMLTEVLTMNPLFASLEEREFETVVMAMERKSYSAGTEILKQHEEGGSHYYVIVSGIVEIIKNGTLVATFTRGQGFGEMELMYVQKCVATVRARSDVETWALDRTTYKKVVMQLSIQRRQLYTELLGNVEFLENMTEYEKLTLADALHPKTYEPGSYIIRRGERNEWMHIVVEGSVEVKGVDEEDSNRMKHVCFLERGACVGELEFLNQHPAVADCIAYSKVRTCMLHRDHFELCMGPILDVLRKTVRQEKYQYYNQQLEDMSSQQLPTARRHRGRAKAVSAEVDEDDVEAAGGKWTPPVIEKPKETLEALLRTVQKCPLFAALQPGDRDVIIRALEPIALKQGDVIVKQGVVSETSYWYIVGEGVAEQSDSEGVLAKYTAGQSFGEVELMYTTAPSASTVVVSPTFSAFRLDRKTYRKIVMNVCSQRRQLYRELLSGVPFLQKLTESQQLVVADALSPVHFSPGDYLVRNATRNEWMYIIVDGVVEVVGKTGRVCELRRGEMVGELEFFYKHAAVADCIAKSHVKACALHRDHFEMCMGPVASFVEETVHQPKYTYYQERRRSMQAHQ